MTFPSPVELVAGAFRWLEYLGLLGFIGVLVVRRLAANPPALTWARLQMQPSLAVALVGGAGTVAVQAVDGSGSAAAVAGHLFGTGEGWVRLARVVAEALALGFCLRGVRLVVAPGLLACVLLAFAGHATSVEPPAAGVLVDALHVLSAGAWAGGIVALATLRPPGGWKEAEGRDMLARFSRVALLAFAITALTGLLRATEELSAVSDLWRTAYGLFLSLKAAGIALMLLLSWLAWRRGLPVARIEAAIAAVVIAVTALLAAIPFTPGEAARIIKVP